MLAIPRKVGETLLIGSIEVTVDSIEVGRIILNITGIGKCYLDEDRKFKLNDDITIIAQKIRKLLHKVDICTIAPKSIPVNRKERM